MLGLVKSRHLYLTLGRELNLIADLSTTKMEAVLGSMDGQLTCQLCRNSLHDRIQQLITEWRHTQVGHRVFRQSSILAHPIDSTLIADYMSLPGWLWFITYIGRAIDIRYDDHITEHWEDHIIHDDLTVALLFLHTYTNCIVPLLLTYRHMPPVNLCLGSLAFYDGPLTQHFSKMSTSYKSSSPIAGLFRLV